MSNHRHRVRVELTDAQEEILQTLIKEAAQLGIPTERTLLLRQIVNAGFEVYSIRGRKK